MLIPSISHGTGLVILLGANGILTNLLGLQFNIYGGLGIILGSVMYSLPVSFLMFYDILKYEDALPYDVAETLGINKFHQLIQLIFFIQCFFDGKTRQLFEKIISSFLSFVSLRT